MSDKRKGFDTNQMQIDWRGDNRTPPVDRSEELQAEEAIATVATSGTPTLTDKPPVLRLRWDFRTRFPEPLPEAVDAGVMAAEDTSPQSVEAIHREHGRRMLGALADLDAVMDERRSTSNLVPAKTDRISEPTRLERWYTSLLGVYEDWFGQDAAEAFDRAVRAWHAHVEVVVDRDAASSSSATSSTVIVQPPPLESQNAAVIDAGVCDSLSASIPPSRRLAARAEKRIIARLPVPKPLPAAVASGHFGTGDQGKPINPSADEVYAITVDHAEKLIDLIRSLPSPASPGRASIEDQIKAGIAKYTADFGPHAAERLEAYCQWQARTRNHAPVSRGR